MSESVSEQSKSKNLPGLYRDPESGKELIAKHHPKFGSAQADGFVRVGYVYVGPAPKDEPKAEDKKETNK